MVILPKCRDSDEQPFDHQPRYEACNLSAKSDDDTSCQNNFLEKSDKEKKEQFYMSLEFTLPSNTVSCALGGSAVDNVYRHIYGHMMRYRVV